MTTDLPILLVQARGARTHTEAAFLARISIRSVQEYEAGDAIPKRSSLEAMLRGWRPAPDLRARILAAWEIEAAAAFQRRAEGNAARRLVRAGGA